MVNEIFKKLNFKDQKQVYVLNAPPSFKPVINAMKDFTTIKTSLSAAKTVPFVLAFVTKQKEVDEITQKVTPLMESDGIVWFAYPKGTSKKYKCEFNRDSGWSELGNSGYEGVRMVAIDEDWSALRFRKAEHIKTMTRSFAMSEEGKRKVKTSSRKKTN